jgi:hypothetical protein
MAECFVTMGHLVENVAVNRFNRVSLARMRIRVAVNTTIIEQAHATER